MVAAADVSIKISIIALSRENPDVFCVQNPMRKIKCIDVL